MTGMRSPDGYGKRRVGKSVNISEGLRKRRRTRGMLYQGKVIKKMQLCILKKTPPSSGGAPDLQPPGSQSMGRQKDLRGPHLDEDSRPQVLRL